MGSSAISQRAAVERPAPTIARSGRPGAVLVRSKRGLGCTCDRSEGRIEFKTAVWAETEAFRNPERGTAIRQNVADSVAALKATDTEIQVHYRAEEDCHP